MCNLSLNDEFTQIQACLIDPAWQHTLNDKLYRVKVSRICANQKAISIISKIDLRTPPPQRAAALKRQNLAVIISS